jgi:hypothetical protein
MGEGGRRSAASGAATGEAILERTDRLYEQDAPREEIPRRIGQDLRRCKR